LDVKDAAHYGPTLVNHRGEANAVRWSTRLTERAREELER